MNELTKTLKAQHRAVQTMAGELERALAGKQSAAVQEVLRTLQGALLAHLQLEEAQLYPSLRAWGQKDGPKSLQTVTVFSHSVPKITSAIAAFFERWINKPLDAEACARDWASVKSSLSMRIDSEETILYPLFDKWTAAAPQGR